MNNYMYVFIASLERLGHISADQAEKFANEIANHMLPGSYKEASRLVEELFDKYDVKPVEKSLTSKK